MTTFHLPRYRKGHTVIINGIPERIEKVDRRESKTHGSFYWYTTASGVYAEFEIKQNKL